MLNATTLFQARLAYANSTTAEAGGSAAGADPAGNAGQ
jgi:hypothetical protein